MLRVHLKSGKVIEFPTAIIGHTVKSRVDGFGDTFVVADPVKGVVGQFAPEAIEWTEIVVDGVPQAREVPEDDNPRNAVWTGPQSL